MASTPINQLRNDFDSSQDILSTPLNALDNDSSLSTSLSDLRQPPSQLPPQPPSQLPPQQLSQLEPSQSSSNNIIDDILKDMDDGKMEDVHNMNMSTYNYSMDRSQVPGENTTSPNFQEQQHSQQPQLFTPSVQPQEPSKSENNFSFLGLNVNLDNLLNPVLVFLIVFILSLTPVNRFIFSLCPQFLKESGQINIYGVLLKGFIGMVIYLVLKFSSKIIFNNNNN